MLKSKVWFSTLVDYSYPSLELWPSETWRMQNHCIWHEVHQVCSSFVMLWHLIRTHAENGQILSVFRMRSGSYQIQQLCSGFVMLIAFGHFVVVLSCWDKTAYSYSCGKWTDSVCFPHEAQNPPNLATLQWFCHVKRAYRYSCTEWICE